MLDLAEDVNGTNDDANFLKRISNVESRRVPGDKKDKRYLVLIKISAIWFVSEWGPGEEKSSLYLEYIEPTFN